jgi:allantoinase
MKRRDTGDFMAAWGGIASLQLMLPVVWTGMRARGLPVERLAAGSPPSPHASWAWGAEGRDHARS